MKLICPKCEGMKKFIVGIPVARKCEEHGSVNMIHVSNEIEMPKDPVEAEETDTTSRPEELPVKKDQSPLESAIAVLPDLGVDVLRNMARDLKVKNWWIMSKDLLINEIGDALKAEYGK